jgi:hypothetical protein
VAEVADTPQQTEALLLISSTCPHCASLLQILTDMVKAGELARLEVINIAVQPEAAQAHAIRSVPWLQLGPFELEGAHSRGELEAWLQRTQTPDGMTAYLRDLLGGGQLSRAIQFLAREPQHLPALLPLLEDTEAEIQVRLGVGAILEELEGDARLRTLVEPLGRLCHHPDGRIRLDAAHYLALTHALEAKGYLEALLQDADAEVREVAQEGLETLAASGVS